MTGRTEVTRRRASPDRRLVAVLATVLGTAALGYLVSLVPGRGVSGESSPASASSAAPTGFDGLRPQPTANPVPESGSPPPGPVTEAVDDAAKLVREAQRLVATKKHDEAIRQLTEAHERLRNRGDAHMVMGDALLRRRDFALARDFFNKATTLDPTLADAYFGFAVASEELGDLESALGGMRAFLHTTRDPDPKRLKIAQARSAIWEWESKLGRGPWGPTRGIPPGFTADELRRDGRGVAAKIPLEHTKDANGVMQYEIKHADKIKIFPRP